ncbi:hypothetical protein FB451DRAFT_750911 [Mycena latifolia]|nr:hypothetical protein FB451DRAFT_750911 [Mycena latifolia]
MWLSCPVWFIHYPKQVLSGDCYNCRDGHPLSSFGIREKPWDITPYNGRAKFMRPNAKRTSWRRHYEQTFEMVFQRCNSLFSSSSLLCSVHL